MALVAVESKDAVAVVRLNNGPTNAVSPALLDELTAALRRVNDEFAGLVLAGGEKFFSIGFDLPVVLELDRAAMSRFFLQFNALLLDLFTLPLPTASAARGHAVGAGGILFLACDYRFAAQGRTLVGLNGIKLGIPMPYLPDMILRQVAGDVVASDMLYRGGFVEAVEAEKKGIVHQVMASKEVEAQALERVRELVTLVPRSFRAAKANRAEMIRARYEMNAQARNEEFLDIWFSSAAQELLRQGAAKFGER